VKYYYYPKLSHLDFGIIRSPGPGLGNLLFPIARCISKFNKYKSTSEMIYPTIPQIKLGTLIRQEKSKRFYFKEFRGRTLKEWYKWSKFNFYKYVFNKNNKVKIISEYNLGNYFYDFYDDKHLIFNWIKNNMSEKISLQSRKKNKIGIHIRRGDFIKKEKNSDHQNQTNFQVEDTWYINCVQKLLEGDHNIDEIVIFTDSKKIDDLIKIFNVFVPTKLDQSKTDIGSLLSLSNCKYIVCSQSTFSMWAAYLGNSKCIWPFNFELSKYLKIEARYKFM
tara:strand:+ start:4109 stop:4939 length:831 start_codon:yes stop_codon:yes gene_type:complete